MAAGRTVDVSDATNAEFTSEELLSQAQGNATALALAAIAYLKDRDLPAEEFFEFVGERFAPGWEELRGRSAKDVARTAALNMVSVGGSLRSLSGEEDHAEVLIAGWPASEFLSELGVTQGESDALWLIFGPIMEYLGLRYAWQRRDEAVRITLEREAPE
jgi:hypothetical protein